MSLFRDGSELVDVGQIRVAPDAVATDIVRLNADLVPVWGAPAMSGASASYPSDTDGVQTLLAATDADRGVVITVRVDETFADNAGAQPTFEIGETDTSDKFAADSEFTDETAGTILTFSGTLSAGKALIVTAVAAEDDGAGGITATVIAVPSA